MIWKLELNNKSTEFFFPLLDLRTFWKKTTSPKHSTITLHIKSLTQAIAMAESHETIKQFIKVDPHQELL